jgi:hypothetical protein
MPWITIACLQGSILAEGIAQQQQAAANQARRAADLARQADVYSALVTARKRMHSNCHNCGAPFEGHKQPAYLPYEGPLPPLILRAPERCSYCLTSKAPA